MKMRQGQGWRSGLAAALIGAAALCGATAAGAQEALTVAEVQRIVAQAANEAAARGRPGTIAVVDRVGNVLAVFQMNGAPATINIDGDRGVVNGLDGLNGIVPANLAAISKAVTGAYLSSDGNAFTTRTASQIVQEHFNPGEGNQVSGPLFGVQFSQLPCSDFAVRFVSGAPQAFIGPKRAPLGLAADPGGIPLYKNGTPVGGIGVLADGVYGLDLRILDFDDDDDEMIAVAGTVGFEAPVDIRANRITVDGKTLRFTDRGREALDSDPGSAPAFAAINGVLGNLIAVRGYNDAVVAAGRAYGTAASGVRAENTGLYAPEPAFVFVDATDTNRFPPRDSTDGGLTAAEVRELITEALRIANMGRAQIRRPLNSSIHVTISVVDTNGAILGIARTTDGPIFGSDVSLQKARTAAFFSNRNAAADLIAGGQTAYVTATRVLVGDDALADGTAYAARTVGNLARPFFPDGNRNNSNGPFSVPYPRWSPFAVGLQLDLVQNDIVNHVLFTAGANPADVQVGCTALPMQVGNGGMPRISNGIQIFPGGVPVYKAGALAGGLGVSGDGIDQDDMISFLGTHNAGKSLASGVGNASQGDRADNLAPKGVRLRYVSCPFKPFVGSDDQDPCRGK